jgi:predicted metal-dependent phosphoesterase TrpH
LDCNPASRIDLHVHSTASDGTLSPSDLLALAHRSQIRALAITDHDTLNGTRQALAAGVPDGMQLVAGVEISASRPPSLPGPGSFHILGYGVRTGHPDLERTLNRLQDARRNRNPQILQRLRNLGIDISMEDLLRAAGIDTQIGRPHIASALVESGAAASIDDAFDRYLGTGKPAYVNKYRVDCASAIRCIRSAGGVAVIAHPGLLSFGGPRRLERVMGELKEMGCEGMEVYYPEHSPQQTARFEALARRERLLMTGGTDFHGGITPDLRLGCGRGDFRVPFHVWETLRNRLAPLPAVAESP